MPFKKLFIGFLLPILLLVGCAPDDDYFAEIDYGQLGYLLSDNSDNFNVSFFAAALRRTGLDRELRENGPFTVLVPSDDAFRALGINTVSDVLALSESTLAELVNFHILDGRYDPTRLPFLFNQQISSRNGKPVFMTRWINEIGLVDVDTIHMVNGSLIADQRIEGSNGLALVIDKVLEPNIYNSLQEAIEDTESVTIFARVMQRAGLGALLRESGPYTVLAPNNVAMAGYGYPTVQSVDSADPSVLADMAKYHILLDRRFINDFLWLTPLDDGPISRLLYIDPFFGWIPITGVKGTQYLRMLDGNVVTITVERYGAWGYVLSATDAIGNNHAFNSNIEAELSGIESIVSNREIMASNGILYVMSGVLEATY